MDWPGLMRVGLGVLRLSPEAFWAMTPREFAAAATALAEAAPPPMTRGDLDALRARFPDDGG
jgi:uncharacterized phage protein (TIGR02216 family)